MCKFYKEKAPGLSALAVRGSGAGVLEASSVEKVDVYRIRFFAAVVVDHDKPVVVEEDAATVLTEKGIVFVCMTVLGETPVPPVEITHLDEVTRALMRVHDIVNTDLSSPLRVDADRDDGLQMTADLDSEIRPLMFIIAAMVEAFHDARPARRVFDVVLVVNHIGRSGPQHFFCSHVRGKCVVGAVSFLLVHCHIISSLRSPPA